MYKMTEVCKRVMKLCVIYTLSFLLEYTASSKDIMVFQSTSEFRSGNLCFRRLRHTVPILYLCVENISPNKYVKQKILLCFAYHTAEQSHSNWHKDHTEIYNYTLKTMLLLGTLL